MLELKGIKKDYLAGENTVHALKGIDLKFRQSEFVSILGQSGCGKTTMLNIIGGLDQYTEGDLIINGRSTKDFKDRDWDAYRNHSIGFVFQSYNLIPHQTVLENVELANQICRAPLDAETVLREVGLGERMKNFPSQLSGGEQQRVAIARALAKNPKLLLCDEPTGALDYQTGKAVLKLLQDTCRNSGMTVIIITHNSALTAMADRVIRVKSGQIRSVTRNEAPTPVEEIEW